uniref:Uncharacterized protein n=1 Tax=Medicago truncatula TaxID=3880 RepID=I3SG42_MEDTR|nr:unknown [Medicago truncatula]
MEQLHWGQLQPQTMELHSMLDQQRCLELQPLPTFHE